MKDILIINLQQLIPEEKVQMLSASIKNNTVSEDYHVIIISGVKPEFEIIKNPNKEFENPHTIR